MTDGAPSFTYFADILSTDMYLAAFSGAPGATWSITGLKWDPTVTAFLASPGLVMVCVGALRYLTGTPVWGGGAVPALTKTAKSWWLSQNASS